MWDRQLVKLQHVKAISALKISNDVIRAQKSGKSTVNFINSCSTQTVSDTETDFLQTRQSTAYLLRGFPFLFIFFLLFLVFHELLFLFLILLSEKRNIHVQLFIELKPQ